MPKVIHTSAKGLVQSSGSSHPYLDFASQNVSRLATQTITQGNGVTGAAGYDDVALLSANTLVTLAVTGAAATKVYLPAANAGTHIVALLSNGASAGDFDCTIVSQGSDSEAARVAAGGTLAVFAPGYARLSNQGIDGSAAVANNVPVEVESGDKTLALNFKATNMALGPNSLISFYCLEDGIWLYKFDNVLAGDGDPGAAWIAAS